MGIINLLKYVPKRYKGFFLNVHSLLNKTFLKKYIPLHSLYIETTSCCNLKCKGCYRTIHDYESKNKHMPLEDFKNYVDQVPKSSSLYLHGLGEPTLNPEIREIIEYASQSKKFNNIAFTTNALAKNPQEYEELFSGGLTQLTISVDSLEQEEVNKMRPLTDVKKLLKNIKWLLEKFPEKIKISMVLNKINLYTFEKTLEKLREIGLKEISFQPCIDFGYPELYLSFKDKKEFLERLKKFEGIGIAFYPSCFSPVEDYCKLPSTAPVINVTGYLTPCCRINDEKVFNVGNLKDKSFKEIFYSKEYSQIQENIERGKYPDFCKNCAMNHTETKHRIGRTIKD